MIKLDFIKKIIIFSSLLFSCSIESSFAEDRVYTGEPQRKGDRWECPSGKSSSLDFKIYGDGKTFASYFLDKKYSLAQSESMEDWFKGVSLHPSLNLDDTEISLYILEPIIFDVNNKDATKLKLERLNEIVRNSKLAKEKSKDRNKYYMSKSINFGLNYLSLPAFKGYEKVKPVWDYTLMKMVNYKGYKRFQVTFENDRNQNFDLILDPVSTDEENIRPLYFIDTKKNFRLYQNYKGKTYPYPRVGCIANPKISGSNEQIVVLRDDLFIAEIFNKFQEGYDDGANVTIPILLESAFVFELEDYKRENINVMPAL